MSPHHNRRLTALALSTPLLGLGFAVLPATAAQAAPDGNTVIAVMETHEEGVRDYLTYASIGSWNTPLNILVNESADGTQLIYTVDDTREIEIQEGCTYPDAADLTKVRCEVARVENASLADFYLYDGDDKVTFTNNTSADITDIRLGDGDDTYTAGRADQIDADIRGDFGQDTITAGSGAMVKGGFGDDIITLMGWKGDVWGDAGNDEIQGSAGPDNLRGGEGADVIYGNDGDDYITGDQGNDSLYGGRENDTLYGNSGDDTIFGNSGDDYISGGPGEDTLSGGAGTNTVVN
ncbi:hypothetical protein LWF15_08155 [Kineosporia rhizophila]|uniref:calcium-binding protein n=1 Tax=Kineosporia TaxID=49184 RepID=UPI001E63E783|nr:MULTISPECIES: calcium-binding protein [Kineosporia]MCE0535479.1 hypothetical protein [Kineosporia rhizophila]GLY16733.1 hypothetical protein Kisp01_37480 [Kineosporia sp. NBRC 101677]